MNNYCNKNEWSHPYVPPQKREVSPREDRGSIARVVDMLQKMLSRFEVTDENIKDMRTNLSVIGEKVDAYPVLINHLELQMNQLSTTVHPRQSGSLPRNNIQNPNNDGQCMAVTTRGGKQTLTQLCRL